MRKKLSAILALASVVLLAYWFTSRLQAEKKFLEHTLELQKSSVIDGWHKKWIAFLKEKISSQQLQKSYMLEWDRFTYKLKESFYPKSISLNWEEFRNSSNQEAFINKALSIKNSWDRVLALTHLQKNEAEKFKKQKLSKFERSTFDESASKAFSKMISQVEKRPSWQMTDSEIEFNTVFYKPIGHGKVLSILPDKKEVEQLFLPEFLKRFSISKASLGQSALDISFQANFTNKQIHSLFKLLPLILSIFLAICSAILFISRLKEDEKEVLRKVSFLNQVVHELKTPLAGLKLHLQLMKQYGFDEESLENSEKSVLRMQSLFDDIYHLQWKSDDDADLEISVNEIERVLTDFNSQHEDKLKIVGSVTTSLIIGPPQFKIILSNLIRNAIRYGEHCTLTIEKNDNSIHFLVSDQGPGIAKEDATKIFNEFYRSKSAQNCSPDGLGLGLSICKKLCEQSRALLTLKNPGEEGAIFELVIREGSENA